ncbi:MAG: GTPase [Gemmataceae bacterium]|nr:50S ribosome-binding GTPase [Gemmata sp.]MDW8199095.1 GTPase [Gemmataceae bacterium]
MSDIVVTPLTPPGRGAIAVVEVRGSGAWEVARQGFRPRGQPLPDQPELHRFWLGTFAGDEVILAVTASQRLEIHCHGGRRVVQRVIDQILNTCPHVVIESLQDNPDDGLYPLLHAPTLRTASILLDQWQGALAEELQRIQDAVDTTPHKAASALARLAEFGERVGKHLVEPWQVVIAGPPNAGKSSLVNALVGYQRSVVSAVPGTTRDPVSVCTAFEGWPVELFDTAGLRDASGLEAEGIALARRRLQQADAIVWVTDATSPETVVPDPETVAVVPLPASAWIWVRNKVDRLPASQRHEPTTAIALSAKTGEHLGQLISAIVTRLVPHPPPPGAAVPYTPGLIERISRANKALSENQFSVCRQLLDDARRWDQAYRTTVSGL